MADYNIERKSRSNYYKSHCRIYNPHVPPVTGADNDDVLKVVDGKWKDAPASGGKEVIFNVDHFTGTVTVSGIEYLNDKFSEGPIVPSDVQLKCRFTAHVSFEPPVVPQATFESDDEVTSVCMQYYFYTAEVISTSVSNDIYTSVDIAFQLPESRSMLLSQDTSFVLNLTSSGEGYTLDGYTFAPSEFPKVGACFEEGYGGTLIWGDLMHAAFNESNSAGLEYSDAEVDLAAYIYQLFDEKVRNHSPENIRYLSYGNFVYSCIGIVEMTDYYILGFYDFWNGTQIGIKYTPDSTGGMSPEIEFYNPEPV